MGWELTQILIPSYFDKLSMRGFFCGLILSLSKDEAGSPRASLHWTPVKEAKTHEARAFWQREIR